MSKVEDVALDLQSGVRKWVLITVGVAVVFAFPVYLLGNQISKWWFYNLGWTNRFDNKNFLNTKKFAQQQVNLEGAEYIDLVDGRRLIYSFLDNRQNRIVGYNPFVYKLQIINQQGETISDEIKNTYLLPAEAKYIAAYTRDLNAVSLSIQKLDDTNPVEYNAAANELLKPVELEIREQTVEDADKDNLMLKTTIKNSTRYFIKNVDLVMLIRDGQDSVIGVQDYKISGFLPNENREVKLRYPKSKNRTAKSLDVRYSVNYLAPDSVRLQ
jgi:hypothetical protein